jgi:hypothetical protein
VRPPSSPITITVLTGQFHEKSGGMSSFRAAVLSLGFITGLWFHDQRVQMRGKEFFFNCGRSPIALALDYHRYLLN